MPQNMLHSSLVATTQMKRYVLIFSMSLLGLPVSTFAQNKFANTNFEVVDSLARTLEYKDDLIKLTQDLTASYSQDISKVRSIFIWITNNIRYDYKFVNAGKEITPPGCEGKFNCAAELAEWENNYIKKVLRKGKAICDGYARLFKKMCDIAGIESDIVPGYAKNKYYQVGVPMSVSHAWNTVKIDSAYYYLDPTWAAGYCTEDEEKNLLTGFVRSYQNYYWLTPPDKLVRDHFPQSGKWAFQTNYTKEKFLDNAFFYTTDVLKNINVLSPTSGVIGVKKGDTIHFKFTFAKNIDKIQVNSNVFRNPDEWVLEEKSRRRSVLVRDTSAARRQVYLPFKRNEDTYEFDYVVKENSLYYMDILFDRKKAIRFKVKVREEN